MRKKYEPHIIAIGAFAAFIVLGLACASTPSIPKEQQQRIKILSQSRYPSENDWGKIRSAPAEGETVLGTYQDTFIKNVYASISPQAARAYSEYRVIPEYKRPVFYPYEIVASLMIRAATDHLDINVDDLDVRSVEQVGDVRVHGSLYGRPSPLTGYYQFYIDETVTFKGVVVHTKKPAASEE